MKRKFEVRAGHGGYYYDYEVSGDLEVHSSGIIIITGSDGKQSLFGPGTTIWVLEKGTKGRVDQGGRRM